MPLLSTQHLVPLAKENLGLRLTGNTTEHEGGGFGDAIPLSHLAGANDIIAFVTLSFLPKSSQSQEQVEAIYNRYKQENINATECMPRLILHYAAQRNISDAKQRVINKKNDNVTKGYIQLQLRSIESEAKKLVSYYSTSGLFYPLELVVRNLPYLSKEIANNFNEKLLLRLEYNWSYFATSNDMDYLFLRNKSTLPQIYKTGYDFQHYPLGKTGAHRFDAADVVKQLMFLGGDDRTPNSKRTLEENIFNAIKIILNSELRAQLNQLQERINSSNYPIDFKSACNKMIALVNQLEEDEILSSEESINLLKMTERLVNNPAEYKIFLTQTKNYQMVAGGRIAAYIMLIAGWAAKIVGVNYAGDAWIKLAYAKLDYLITIEECANAGQASSKSA